MLNEPRGGAFRHVNLLVPPNNPRADMASSLWSQRTRLAMSGSNGLCVATVLLETGIRPMTEPETVMSLDASGGLIRVSTACRSGRGDSVRVHNAGHFRDRHPDQPYRHLTQRSPIFTGSGKRPVQHLAIDPASRDAEALFLLLEAHQLAHHGVANHRFPHGSLRRGSHSPPLSLYRSHGCTGSGHSTTVSVRIASSSQSTMVRP